LNKLDSSDPNQQKLKELISDKDVFELNNIGMGCIYGLKEIHDVSEETIESAQAQILSGIALQATCLLFPPALAVCGPISGTLISEGISDIITALMNQGVQEFNKKDYKKSKIISYGIALVTMGIGAIMSSTKILSKVMNTCRNLASKLRSCKRFKTVCEFLAKNLEKLANYLEKTIETIKFINMSVENQRKCLTALQNANKFKSFIWLQKQQMKPF